MTTAPKDEIGDQLQVFDLRRTTLDLQQTGNRRFMYHSSGVLILGAEDEVNSSDGLYKSHAEEFGEACDRSAKPLPPYDSFVRGWIGVSCDYPYGIIHFAPHVSANNIPYFNTAFDFIEAALRNGFQHKSLLRGFCGAWEQPFSRVIEPIRLKAPLDAQICTAQTKAAAQPAGEGRASRGPIL